MKFSEMFKKCHELLNSTSSNKNLKMETSLTTPSRFNNFDQETYQDSKEHTIIEKDDMTMDLMKMVGGAIEQWSKKYHMENLPKKIIFKQALTIMNGMEQLWFYE